MANNSLDDRLAALYQKRDHIDQFYDEDLKTIIDAIRDAREHGGTASVDVTPISGGGGYTITITDSEGTEHTATVKDGGDAYEVYKSTVPSGETPMSKIAWLASLKGADGQDGVTPTIDPTTKQWMIGTTPTGVLAEGHNHNRGTYNVGDTFPSDGVAGDYIVVVDDTQSTPTAEIYKWDTSQSNWDATGVSPNDAAFEDGQLLPNTKIDDTQLANPADNALAKAKDVAPIKLSLEDHYVTDAAINLKNGTVTSGEDDSQYIGWELKNKNNGGGAVQNNKVWRKASDAVIYSSYEMNLTQYKANGYTKLKLKAKNDHVGRYYLTKESLVNTDDNTDVSSKLSSVMEEGYVELSAGQEVIIDIPQDAAYLYAIYAFGVAGSQDSYTLGEMYVIKQHLVNSIIPKVINNLESEDTANSLSAKQGSVLKEDIGNLEKKVFGGDIVSEYGATIDETTQCGAWFKSSEYTFDGEYSRSRYAELDTESIGENSFLRITANNNRNAAATFLRSNTGITTNGLPNYSEIMGTAHRLVIPNGEIKDFKLASDMKYIVLFNKNKNAPGNEDGAFMPLKIQYVEKEVYEGVAATIPSGLEVASKPAPPKVYNLAIGENGKLEESVESLITARIYGNFMCMVRDGYKITNVMRCDSNGAIVNERISSLNQGVFEASLGLHTKQQFGVINQLPEYGVMIEVKKENEDAISAEEEIWEWFMWGTNSLTSELDTLPRYNGQEYNDSATDEDRIYTHESVMAAVQRMKIGAMLVWQPLRYIMPTHAAWRDIQYKTGTIQYGVPYSRANLRERWALMDVSPYTFLTAIANPYSVIYTERIGRGTSSEDWKSATEYSINTNLYQSGHGIPYYGLVCSAYASYVYGFYTANQTASFPTDTARNYVISKHREATGSGWTNAAVNARTIPALCVITRPGHTYIVVDFLCDASNERIAAIVAEETEPNIKVGLYPIDRLQERFDYEYQHYCIDSNDSDKSIEVTTIKPSILDENKDRLLWKVENLYFTGTEKEKLLGMCRKLIKPDPNIMFYMGDKAVVTTYDTTNYTGNDKCWLIVKPDNVYTDVVVQRAVNGEWSNVGEPISIETYKSLYSDENTDYFKIDVTSSCSNAGKYRAYLTGVDESQNTVQSGDTQWIVVNIIIEDDPTDATRVIWSVDNSHCSEGNDEYAEIVAVGCIYADGSVAQGYDYTEESNAKQSSLLKTYFTTMNGKCRVIAMTKWGAAHRDKNIS